MGDQQPKPREECGDGEFELGMQKPVTHGFTHNAYSPCRRLTNPLSCRPPLYVQRNSSPHHAAGGWPSFNLRIRDDPHAAVTPTFHSQLASAAAWLSVIGRLMHDSNLPHSIARRLSRRSRHCAIVS